MDKWYMTRILANKSVNNKYILNLNHEIIVAIWNIFRLYEFF